MDPQAPRKIAINHDDDCAQYVGTLPDGRQFFMTTPFVPVLETEGREFLALYLFDAAGDFLDARIDDLGTRATLDLDKLEALEKQHLQRLGNVTFGKINVAPFSHTQFGVTFGLIVQAPEKKGEDWVVTAEPGDYMAFYAPWDSGVYDT